MKKKLKKKSKRKAGRPQRQFTTAQIKKIDEMARNQCKDTAIAEVIGINVVTFKDHFLKRCRQKRAEGKAIKLNQQFANKTPTMLIWWGKQYLEQADKHQLGEDNVLTVHHVYGRDNGQA